MAFDVEEANLVATCHLLLDMYTAQPREASAGPTEAQGSAAEGCAGRVRRAAPAHRAPKKPLLRMVQKCNSYWGYCTVYVGCGPRLPFTPRVCLSVCLKLMNETVNPRLPW